MRNPPCQLRIIVSQEIYPLTFTTYHWKKRFKIEDSPVETVSMAPQFRQIIKPAQVSGLSMTLPNGISIGLDGMSMED